MRLWDLRPWETAVEVSVRGFAAPTVDGAIVHRSYDLEPVDVECIHGLPVTSVERTLVDAGSYLGDGAVERAVDSAIGTGRTTVARLRAMRERVGRHGRAGVTAIDRALGDAAPGIDSAESPMEIALLRLIIEHGIAVPVSQFEVSIGSERFRADFAYPDAALLIEYDGYREHIAADRFERDRRRQNLLQLHGWLVLRFTKSDVRDRGSWVAGQISAALRNRSGDPR
ncbi:MAG: DUF559 domain-containing protein [Actinomycetota bacterium]